MRKKGTKPIVYRVSFPNGKSYIGITSSALNCRKSEHYSKMRKGKGHRFHLALAKYQGQETWAIIRYCKDYSWAKNWEKAFIKKLNSKLKGYNLTDGGDGNSGYQVSEETRRRLSESHKGHKQSAETIAKRMEKLQGQLRTHRRRVVGESLITGEVFRYESLTELEAEGFFDKSCVAKCCVGQRQSHKKFKWKYEAL